MSGKVIITLADMITIISKKKHTNKRKKMVVVTMKMMYTILVDTNIIPMIMVCMTMMIKKFMINITISTR